MPIFDYRCTRCEHIQEVITTSVTQEPILKCDECGNDEMSKLMPDQMNFKLNGEGWANEGYSYTYSKSKAGISDNVRPVYSKKKAKEALKKYKDNTFADGVKSERIK